MTRVFICEQWNERKRYWEFVCATDSPRAADRWRRDQPGRKFVDYVVLNDQEAQEFLSEQGPPQAA